MESPIHAEPGTSCGAFRALRCRSVHDRSTNAVLIAVLYTDIPSTAATAASVPNTTRVAILTTRPFSPGLLDHGIDQALRRSTL